VFKAIEWSASATGMEAGTLRLAKDGLCALCYSKATMLCSKCKQRWYCTAACQAKDWLLGHKGDCGLMDLAPAAVPFPPPAMLPDSVECPVVSDASWCKLLSSTDVGLRRGPPRGLRNVGNTCYMNAVLQGLYYSVPPLFKACEEHRVEHVANGTCSAAGSCFRCDMATVASTCIDPLAQVPAESSIGSGPRCESTFAIGDYVVLQGVKNSELNGQIGVIEQITAATLDDENEARFGIRLRETRVTVGPCNLQLRCRLAVAPSEVAQWLPRLNSEFTFGMQEDAHEFLRSVLRLVEDEELTEHADVLRRRAGMDGSAENKTVAANADLTASPSRIFGGIVVSQSRCPNKECGGCSNAFEAFMDLSLNITEATDTVEDALRFFTAPERLDKQNPWTCSGCNKKVRAQRQTTIYSVPNFLVLHLKRFRYEGRGKVTRPVTYSSELNMRPFLCASTQDSGKPLVYELRAVVVHLDKFGFSHFGHYVTYVRCAVSGDGTRSQWHVLDDSVGTEVSEQEVMSQQAYLLIYAASATLPVLRRGSSAAAVSQGGNSAIAELESAPVRCRGRDGEVCSFFACNSDGLCTRCFQAENGTRPAEATNSASEAKPTAAAAAAAAAAATGNKSQHHSGRPAKHVEELEQQFASTAGLVLVDIKTPRMQSANINAKVDVDGAGQAENLIVGVSNEDCGASKPNNFVQREVHATSI